MNNDDMRDSDMAANKRPLIDFPVRTCKTMVHCCCCGESITLGEQYHDGGYWRRAHLRCADLAREDPERELSREEQRQLESRVGRLR